MKKKIKMLVYGSPGVGKSVFASKSQNPFFITTDGNYQWLEDFGAKPEAHKQVNSWKEFLEFVKEDSHFNNYDTIVIDLLEDLFEWAEYEFVKKNKLEHIGDLGFGKGYSITRGEFFIEISKLINKDKHIILIMHETTASVKDRRGVESTVHRPSKELPEKLLDKIEGRLRFVVRAYSQEIEENGIFKHVRLLSITPKQNEYGILRGINDSRLTSDIPLDYKAFADLIETNVMTDKDLPTYTSKKKVKEEVKKPNLHIEDKIEDVNDVVKESPQTEEELKKEELLNKLAKLKNKTINVEETQKTQTNDEVKEVVVEETQTKNETVKETESTPEVDKMTLIKIKLRAAKAGVKPDKLDTVINYILKNQNISDEELKSYVEKL